MKIFVKKKPSYVLITEVLALFPDPAQLSITFSMEQKAGWGLGMRLPKGLSALDAASEIGGTMVAL